MQNQTKYAVLNEPGFTLDDHSIYAVGDVHGYSTELRTMLEFIKENKHGSKPPVVFFLGDLNDRGPDTKGVFELVMQTVKELPGSTTHIGNHEQYMVDFAAGMFYAKEWREGYIGGAETIASFKDVDFGKVIPDKYLDFLSEAPDITQVDEYVFSHTGFNPTVSLTEQNVNAVRSGGAGNYFFMEPLNQANNDVKHAIFGHYGTMGAPWVWDNNKHCVDTSVYENGGLTCALVNKGESVRYFTAFPGDVREAAALDQTRPRHPIQDADSSYF